MRLHLLVVVGLAGCPGTIDGSAQQRDAASAPSDDGVGDGDGDAAVAVAGDPARGYSYIVNANYVGCGIPREVVRRGQSALRQFAPYLFPEDVITGDPGIPGREGANAGVNYAFNAFTTPRGVVAVNFNCLSCHAERLGGQVIVGLGDTTRGWVYDLAVLANAAGLLVNGDAERAEWSLWKSRATTLSPLMRAKMIGVSPAINTTYALFAHRDPTTLAWSDRALIEPPPDRFPPVDVPPWWQMKRRHTMFANGELPVHRRVMMLASTLCTDSVADAQALDAGFVDVEAFIRQLAPPAFPGALDQALVAAGKPIYDSVCAGCHGTPATYPERFVDVGTDLELARQELEQSQRFRDWFAASYYGELGGPLTRPLGYVAPPLDGVWATAPYFHNGSIPTLEGVLDSTKRPRYWKRTFDPADYDIANASWTYRSVGGPDPPYVYDTTAFGQANGGHTFGDTLTTDERRAVIEYVKSL